MAKVYLQKDLTHQNWIGIVTNNKDVTFSGRAQIRVFGLLDEIPSEHLPWATPIYSNICAGNGAGNISIPKIGQFMRVNFYNGDIYSPEYTAIQNIDTELIDKIKTDYEGTHVLLFDPIADLSIIYQPLSGIQIFQKGSYFQIGADSMITMQTPDNESTIQMEGDITRIVTKNNIDISAANKVSVNAEEVAVVGAQTTKVGTAPYFHGVLAEPLITLLTSFATALDAKFPPTPGVNAGLIESLKQTMTSTNVLIGK
jgi:hypothetical protein